MVPLLRTFAQRTVEVGLAGNRGKWDSLSVSYRKKVVVYRKPKYTTSPLQLKDVKGAFYILIVGCIIGIVVLLFEIKSWRNVGVQFRRNGAVLQRWFKNRRF